MSEPSPGHWLVSLSTVCDFVFRYGIPSCGSFWSLSICHRHQYHGFYRNLCIGNNSKKNWFLRKNRFLPPLRKNTFLWDFFLKEVLSRNWSEVHCNLKTIMTVALHIVGYILKIVDVYTLAHFLSLLQWEWKGNRFSTFKLFISDYLLHLFGFFVRLVRQVIVIKYFFNTEDYSSIWSR